MYLLFFEFINVKATQRIQIILYVPGNDNNVFITSISDDK